MRLKSLITGAAVAVVAGGVALGATSLASGAPVASAPAVQPVVFGEPLPQQPPAPVPSAAELTGILTSLANPGVPFSSKDYLIEGGVGPIEGRTADRLLRNAAQDGYLPLTFGVTDILPAGPAAATATVTASGPQLAPTTQSVTFVNQGGWKLSRASATSLLQAALA